MADTTDRLVQRTLTVEIGTTMAEPDRLVQRTITVEIFGPNNFTISEAGKSADRLCWDEVLGAFAEMTHPAIGRPRYTMLTAEEHAIREAKHQRVIELHASTPGWRDMKYPNGRPKFTVDGTMLDDRGNRSIFDDVDQ